MFVAERQMHFEIGAIADVTLNINGTAVHGDELVHQCKAYAASFVAAAACTFNAAEALKQIGQLVFGDAGSGVVDCEQGAVVFSGDGDADLAVEGGFEGVGEEVEDD